MEAAQNCLHSWIPSLPEIFTFLIEKNVHCYVHSFIYSFLLQTCIECLLLGHTLFWGHSGEQGKMEALTLVEHLIEMQRDSKWTKISMNLMNLGSSRCWSGSKLCSMTRGFRLANFGWVIPKQQGWGKSSNYRGPKWGNELGKKEKQEAGQCSWRAESGRMVGDVGEVEGN